MTSPQQKPNGKFGARVFVLDPKVACVYQTIKSGEGYTDRYIVHTDSKGKGRHRFVDEWNTDDGALAEVVRDALKGKL